MLGARNTVGVRRAELDDAFSLVEVFRSSWRDAYTGIIPVADLDRLIRYRTDAWWQEIASVEKGLLTMTVSGDVAGYARIGAARGRYYRNVGEIQELYLAPIYQGIGLGEHLFEACRAKLDAEGYNGLLVRCLSDNERACLFYMNRGGRARGDGYQTYGKVKLKRHAFRWA